MNESIGFTHLPLDLWKLVFSFYLTLNDMVNFDTAVTNKKTRTSYLDTIRHKSLAVDGAKKKLDGAYFRWIRQRGLCIRHVHIDEVQLLNELREEQLSKVTTISKHDLDETDVKSLHSLIIRNSQTIVNVTLPFSRSSAALISLFPYLSNIVKLDLSFTPIMLEQDVFEIIFKPLAKLRSITMVSCSYNARDFVVALMRHCPEIEDLFLDLNHGHLKDSHLLALVQSFHINIKSLGLGSSLMLTDIGLTGIGRYCPNLQYLNLHDMQNITDNSFVSLGNTSLTKLILSKTLISEYSLCKLLENSEKLIYLDVSNCPQITDYTLIRLAENCPDLVYLDLTYCYKVSDVGVLAISTGCLKLSTLVLNYCQFITEEGITLLATHRAQGKCLQNLTSLSISCLTCLTDTCILQSSGLFEPLKELKLTGCTLLSDMTMIHLLVVCSKLRHLSVADNYRITNLSIDKILFTQAYELRELDVSYCNVTMDRVDKLRQKTRVKVTALHL